MSCFWYWNAYCIRLDYLFFYLQRIRLFGQIMKLLCTLYQSLSQMPTLNIIVNNSLIDTWNLLFYMIIILILFFFPLEFTNETDVHTFAVFGEKCVTIVDYHSAAQSGKNGGPLDHSDYSITITTRAQMTEFEDWIWDAVFLKPVRFLSCFWLYFLDISCRKFYDWNAWLLE